MTVNVITLTVDGKDMGYVPHSETVDITTSHIYSTFQEAWDKRRDSDWLKCNCGTEGVKAHANCAGCGEWDMWVCFDCRAVIFCPESMDSMIGVLEYGGSDEQIAASKALIAKYKDRC